MSTERIELKSALPPDLIASGWKLWMRDSASPFIAENENLDMDTGGFPTKDEAIAKAVELMTDEEERAAIASDGSEPEAITMEMGVQVVKRSLIRKDGGTQPRESLNMIKIEEYREAKKAGAQFPAVEILFDGKHLWMWDGFHRDYMEELEGSTEILANVQPGSQRDAILASLGANATHGLPRTNEDKRRAVLTALRDPEWTGWSDTLIAEKLHVSQPFVGHLRKDLISQNVLSEQSVRVGRDGVARDTSNIGKAADEDDSQPSFSEITNDAGDGALYEFQGTGETEWKAIDEESMRKWLSASFDDVDAVVQRMEGDRTVVRTPQARFRRHGSTGEPIVMITPDAERAESIPVFGADVSSQGIVTDLAEAADPKTDDGAEDFQHTAWEATFSPSAKQVRELIKLNGGTASLMQLEEVDISSAMIHNALAEGAIEQPERGLFRLPPERKQDAQPEPPPKAETSDTKREPASVSVSKPKPTVEELLKGRKLSVSFTWVPGLVGQVSVSVNMGNKPTDASRLVIDAKEVPRFPEDIVVAIHHQLKQTRTDEYEAKKKPKIVKRAAASTSTRSKTTSRKPTKKKAAKKAPKRGGKK